MPVAVGIVLVACFWHFSRGGGRDKHRGTLRGRNGKPLSREALQQLQAAGISEADLKDSLLKEALDPEHRRVAPPRHLYDSDRRPGGPGGPGGPGDPDHDPRLQHRYRRTHLDDDD